jgi:hypothetical protein
MYSIPLKRYARSNPNTPKSKKRKTPASATKVQTPATAERLGLPPVGAKKIQKHTSVFHNLVDLMKIVSEASVVRHGTLTDAELAVVLFKYYGDIILSFAFSSSELQPNRRTYSTLTNEDKNNMLLANRITWKGEIQFNENALEKVEMKASLFEQWNLNKKFNAISITSSMYILSKRNSKNQ